MKNVQTFGEYLVAQNAISEEVLLQTLLSQVKTMPTICELVVSLKAIPVSSLIQVLSLQSRKRMDFISACKELGFWSESIEQMIWSELDKSRTPIVQTLVEKGIGFDQINKHLDSYLTLVGEVSTNPSPPPGPVSVSIPIAVEEFGAQFNDALNSELLASLDQMVDASSGQQMIELTHRLAGASRFAALKRAQAFFDLLEKALQSRSSGAAGAVPLDLASFKTAIKSGLDAVWRLRLFVLRTGAEDGFEKEDPKGNELLTLCMQVLEKGLEVK